MNIVDCIWEQENLGERVCEVTVNIDEDFEFDAVSELDKQYTYHVIKVAVGNVPYILQLQKLGYSLIETQLDWSTKIKDFNINQPLLERLRPILSFQEIIDIEDFDGMLSQINDNMFSTDRIALDPHYGMVIGRKRYCNWMTSEFKKKTSLFAYIILDGTRVGFLMLTVKGQKGHGALAGIFKEYQDMGFGILTSSSMPLYIIEKGLNVKTYETSTSSNNVANTKFYTTLGFQLKSMHYVFVKHVSK